MDSRLITLEELYNQADSIRFDTVKKEDDLKIMYQDYRTQLKSKIETAFKAEGSIELQLKIIELLDLEVSKLDTISAYFIMPYPFTKKWWLRGRYLYYFDTVKLKLGGLIYHIGNANN